MWHEEQVDAEGQHRHLEERYPRYRELHPRAPADVHAGLHTGWHTAKQFFHLLVITIHIFGLNSMETLIKYQYYFIAFLGILAALIFGSLYFLPNSEEMAEDISASPFTIIDSFPDPNSEVFIQRAVDMLFDGEHIYISDQSAHSILKFTASGSFIQSIGREGRGPGEFRSQRNMAISGDTLIVNNGWNVQIFNTLGEDITWFPSVGMGQFTMHKGKLVAIKPSVNPRFDENYDDQYLLKVLDNNFKMIDKFCPMLDFVPTEFPFHRWLANQAFLDIYDGRLYVMFRHYPIMRIYNLEEMSLLREINLAELNPRLKYQERAERNYDPESFKIKEAIGLFRVFRGLDVTSEGIFINLQADYLLLDHFSLDGIFQNRYHLKPNDSEKLYMIDFAIIDESSLYALVTGKDQQVMKLSMN